LRESPDTTQRLGSLFAVVGVDSTGKSGARLAATRWPNRHPGCVRVRSGTRAAAHPTGPSPPTIATDAGRARASQSGWKDHRRPRGTPDPTDPSNNDFGRRTSRFYRAISTRRSGTGGPIAIRRVPRKSVPTPTPSASIPLDRPNHSVTAPSYGKRQLRENCHRWSSLRMDARPNLQHSRPIHPARLLVPSGITTSRAVHPLKHQLRHHQRLPQRRRPSVVVITDPRTQTLSGPQSIRRASRSSIPSPQLSAPPPVGGDQQYFDDAVHRDLHRARADRRIDASTLAADNITVTGPNGAVPRHASSARDWSMPKWLGVASIRSPLQPASVFSLCRRRPITPSRSREP